MLLPAMAGAGARCLLQVAPARLPRLERLERLERLVAAGCKVVKVDRAATVTSWKLAALVKVAGAARLATPELAAEVKVGRR